MMTARVFVTEKALKIGKKFSKSAVRFGKANRPLQMSERCQAAPTLTKGDSQSVKGYSLVLAAADGDDLFLK